MSKHRIPIGMLGAVLVQLVVLLGFSSVAFPDEKLSTEPEISGSVNDSADDSVKVSATQKPARSPAGLLTDDEYNFSWLDSDKKIFVLQNRKFNKAKRFAAYISGGLNLSNPYRTAAVVSPRIGYYFTNQWGIEFAYANVMNADNATLTDLKRASTSALPFVREQRYYLGAAVHWSPWYAKINFFNLIGYFDWFLNAGGGSVATAVDENTRASGSPRYREESFPAFFFGTGQSFFLSNHFLIRWDLVGVLYRAKGGDNITDRTYDSWDFSMGVGYMF